MSNIYDDSIVPLSDLRSDLNKVKSRLKKTPVIITINGRPDFGVCDLETLEIAMKIRDLRELLKKRYRERTDSELAEGVFRRIAAKYHAKEK